MRRRKLGGSDLEVGEVSLGTWGLSGEGYGPIDATTARATIAAALDAGVNLIETAAGYGENGAVESLVGAVLAERDPDTALVATRIGVDRGAGPGSLPRKRFGRVALARLAEDSLRRLRRERIDLLLLHNPLPETLRNGEAIDALFALREAGKARLVGASVGSLAAGHAALAHAVDVIELPYNLLYPTLLHGLAAEISSRRAGVLARSPLAYGILAGTWAASRQFGEFDHRAERWAPADVARRVRQREAARFLVHDHVTSLREAALRYVLTNQLVSTAVVGARTPDQARENAVATAALPLLPDVDLARVAGWMREEGVVPDR